MEKSNELIVLGVITYNRPVMLASLLESLIKQNIYAIETVKTEFVLVDNSSDCNAQELFSEYSKKFTIPCHYYHEKKQGIPFARNAVLDIALQKQADFVAFIDDDEIAEQEWLLNLYQKIKEFECDSVQGPVVPLYPDNMPDWGSDVIKYKEFTEGERGDLHATNNLIFNARLISEMNLRFDKDFSLSGGSDTDFFLRASKLGAIGRLTNKAKVYEHITLERFTVRWQLRRSFRAASGAVYSYKKNYGAGFCLRKYFFKIIRRLASGIIILPFSVFSKALLIRAVRKVSSAFGYIMGFWGIMGKEYRKIVGY